MIDLCIVDRKFSNGVLLISILIIRCSVNAYGYVSYNWHEMKNAIANTSPILTEV